MENAKIIQLVKMPNDATWQGVLLGLGDDGATYVCSPKGEWEHYIPPIGTPRTNIEE